MLCFFRTKMVSLTLFFAAKCIILFVFYSCTCTYNVSYAVDGRKSIMCHVYIYVFYMFRLICDTLIIKFLLTYLLTLTYFYLFATCNLMKGVLGQMHPMKQYACRFILDKVSMLISASIAKKSEEIFCSFTIKIKDFRHSKPSLRNSWANHHILLRIKRSSGKNIGNFLLILSFNVSLTLKI